MRRDNESTVSEFILLGLPIRAEEQGMYFALFLAMYLTTVLGNLLIILLIRLDSHLHTPMYFFLSHLAFTDISFSSVTAPKMLVNMLTHSQSISYAGCISQEYFFTVFAGIDSFLLTSMAYDRYVAICHPLKYTTVMSPKICSLLVFGAYLMGFAGAMTHTGFMIRLSFCNSNIINHYMCDIFPLLQLSCTSTYVNELVSSAVVGTIIILSSLIILVSYAMILSNILHMSSSKGWSKALGTCGSHIITVSLFYGSGLLAYIKPTSAETVDQGKFLSIFYTLVIPMLNPLIYSLRNKDVKLAVKRTMKRVTS